MNLLVDTHLVLWAAVEPRKLPVAAKAELDDPNNDLFFSVVSLWEVAIKFRLGRADFDVDPRRLWRGLQENDWRELTVLGPHALATAELPPLHKDPFDRLLLAQAQVEGLTLITSDARVAQYPGRVQKV